MKFDDVVDRSGEACLKEVDYRDLCFEPFEGERNLHWLKFVTLRLTEVD